MDNNQAGDPNQAPSAAPFWSVVLPAYNPAMDDLRQSLQSVLQQDPGPDRMQIAVIDDCSPKVDVAAMVASIGGKRIEYIRNPRNLGLAGCWNACIGHARGRWVHILHQDDYVLPGFYGRLESAAARHPDAGLLATRSFYVDGSGIITGVTPRVEALENGGHAVEGFFYGTSIQCSGVVVRRSIYEAGGGFRTDLNYCLDCEMWARIIGSAGGVVVPEVFSCYRSSGGNETTRLSRTAENLRDLKRLDRLFASRYQGFDRGRSMRLIAHLAYCQMDHFQKRGDAEAVAASRAFWRQEIPLAFRIRNHIVKLGRAFFG